MDEFELDKYEEECEIIREENEQLLELFREDLNGLSPKTIDRHLDNVDFYINTYLLREEAYDFTQGIGALDDYLGYFL